MGGALGEDEMWLLFRFLEGELLLLRLGTTGTGWMMVGSVPSTLSNVTCNKLELERWNFRNKIKYTGKPY